MGRQMASRMRVALLAFIFAVRYAVPADASSIDSAFWLKQYEHADPTWNNVAHAYVLGILDGAGEFGGIRCPDPVSPRTLAAVTADVIKQTSGNEPALNAIMKAAIRLRCVVDTDLIRRAADKLEKERKR
jgi:hypothetical protein